MRRWAAALAAGSLWLGGCATLTTPPVEGDAVPVEAPRPVGNGRVELGQPYFDFTAPELRGGQVTLSALVGPKVVVLQFWGIRCVPCLAEMKLLIDLQARYGAQGLQVIGVNADRIEAPALLAALAARELAPNYPTALDPDLAISKRYTHWLVPVTVLIGRDGVVRAIHTGYRPELDAVIEGEIRELLGR
ncbi:MAG: peroxiredoxin family protein [Deferrisomatales bacterium]